MRSDSSAAWLHRFDNLSPGLDQSLGQPADLGGLAAAVHSLKCNEYAALLHVRRALLSQNRHATHGHKCLVLCEEQMLRETDAIRLRRILNCLTFIRY